MTRMKPRKIDDVRKALVGIDRILVNRNDTDDQTRIHDLDNKMNEKSSYGTFGHFGKIHLRNMTSPSNKKTGLKNSNRY